jgi:hypothetical protein
MNNHLVKIIFIFDQYQTKTTHDETYFTIFAWDAYLTSS